MHTITDKRLLMLKPEEIVLSENQPRKSFDQYDLKLLADSITSNGIIQPLSVRKKEEGGYELIAGERRLRAAVMVGLRRVPCVLHKTDDITAALYAVIENIQRKDLTVFEEAKGIERLIIYYGMSQSEVAAGLGIAQSTLSNKLRLLRLSAELQERITEAGLTERHARALLKLSELQRESALDRIIAEGLNLKQTEEFIEDLLEPKSVSKPDITEYLTVRQKPLRKSAIGDVRLFSNSLSKLLVTLQNAGIDAHTRKYENDKYIEYKVRINKEQAAEYVAEQLKIC